MQSFKSNHLPRIAGIISLVLVVLVYPVHAENGDQAPQRETMPTLEIDAGLFDFSKTLEGIMKTEAKPAEAKISIEPFEPVKPKKKPAKKTLKQEHVENVPIPPRKPKKIEALTAKPSGKPNFKDVEKEKSLSSKQAELYQKIFALQKEGEMSEADKYIADLKDDRLYGYVLQQRYLHPTAYTSKFNELKDWLDNYADYPGAMRIYELAERKRPQGSNIRLTPPKSKVHIIRRAEPTMIAAKRYASSINRTADDIQKVRELQRVVSLNIKNGELEAAENALEEDSILDTVERDIMSARIAAAYLYKGRTKQAYKLASKSAERSGLHVPLAGWVSGLVSWKQGKYSKAAGYFENVGRSNYASSWTRSAGAYWAARAHMRRGDVKSVSTWLRRAASTPRTFYGLIATRALGENFDFNWRMPTFTRENHKILSSNPNGVRAIALAKIGEYSKAQAELLRIDPSEDENMYEALLAFSGYVRLPGLAMRLGSKPANAQQNVYYDAALYPVGPWKPFNGYKMDTALMNAIIRQESRFDPDATSSSGAKGLMQLMPATARSVSDYDDPQMDDPEVNLELGQRYLKELLKSPYVDNNLLSLLIAYNAGPGNLNKWRNQWPKIKDPLLFIELLPSSETRAYVEHVLANFWIYRMRDKQATPTLDAVVAGAPIKYASSGYIQTASAQ